MANEYAKVYVLEAPYFIDAPFDYFVPHEMREKIGVGAFVTVPFGSSNRRQLAVVVSLSDHADYAEAIKPILAIANPEVTLGEEMLGLCRFMKEQTLCTFGEAVHAMVPSAALSGLDEIYSPTEKRLTQDSREIDTKALYVYEYVLEKGRVSLAGLKSKFGDKVGASLKKLRDSSLVSCELEIKNRAIGTNINFYELKITEDEATAIVDGKSEGIKLRSAKHREILRFLLEHGKMPESDIIKALGVTRTQIRALVDKELLSCESVNEYRSPYDYTSFGEKKDFTLNDEQSEALDTIASLLDSGEPRAALLHGITGSGKTCVMLAAIDKAVSDGRGVIVLLPEIALTPQSIEIFSSRYGDRVAIIHSGLSSGERLDTYMKIRRGDANIVVGTRSAVFAPVKNLGMIVIDEEQEHTYKSDQNPKYHAKDIARYRCAHNNALMLLASATPSLESYKKAEDGVYTLIKLKSRFGEATLPDVTVADMRREAGGGAVTPLGSRLTELLVENQRKKEQAILFLNRRGYNNYVSCRMCGGAVTCPDCSVSMTYHTRRGRYDDGELVCHWCGRRMPLPKVCPACESTHLSRVGFGTQRLEQELNELLPTSEILRMDTDTTGGKFSYDKMLGQFKRHEADVLVGTQMVTKGHDFPDVTLVGVLSADASLYIDDYRAAERTFAMLTQVIGRAGRADKKGCAVIQTSNPDNDVIKLACAQDYETFYAREIKLRKLLSFPPFCDIVLMTLTGADEKEVLMASKRLADEYKIMTAKEYADVPSIAFGPFEAPVYRVENKYRMRMVVKCRLNKRSRELFSRLLIKFGKEGGKKPSLSVDFNPSSL